MDMSRGSRRPRLEDVAARVGMSPASVSMVLSNAPGPSAATRERVLEAAAELGYRPDRTASLLARRRTHLVGVLLQVSSPFHAQLAALGRQLPVVVIGRRVAGGGVDVVRTADAEGVGQIVDHLATLGHRSIAYVDGGRGTIAADRRRGYRTAMRRHGLADHVRVIAGDHTEAAGTRAARALLDDGALPGAVVAYNDSCALGLLDAFNRAGVGVPADVSVAGYDDSSLARLAHVNLTTVSQDARGQAEHAVAAAVERLDGGRVRPREVVLAPRLVVRGTTGPPLVAGAYPGRAGRARDPGRGTSR